MFELLDEAHRKAHRKAIVRPRYGFLAVLSLLLIGAEAGILIGKGNRNVFDWLAVGINGFVLLLVLAPLFRELYHFLRDHEVN
jgi:hypothetical protein